MTELTPDQERIAELEVAGAHDFNNPGDPESNCIQCGLWWRDPIHFTSNVIKRRQTTLKVRNLRAGVRYG